MLGTLNVNRLGTRVAAPVLMLSALLPRAGPPRPQVVGSGELISSCSWGSRGPGSTWELRVLCRHRFYSACHFLDVALGKLMKITQQEGATGPRAVPRRRC